MRVLIISPKIYGAGGVAQHVSKLVEKLSYKGYEVYTISVANTPHIPIKGLYNPSFASFSVIKALVDRGMGLRYDIVHGHNLPTWLCIKASKADVKVMTFHGIYYIRMNILYGKLFGFLGKWFEKYVVRSVDRITCVSRSTYDYYKRLGADAEYIPNAIDFKDMPREGIRLYDKQAIFIGRLSREKGIDILLRALKYIDNDIHIIVIGFGPLSHIVERECRTYPNLHYLGYKPRSESLKYLAGSDLLILPSLAEGLPTVLLEAMTLKVPIIASRIPGVLDAVNQMMAVLVPPGKPKELAKAINRHIMNYSRNLIERAYRRVLLEFNWDVIINKYIKFYESLLNKDHT